MNAIKITNALPSGSSRDLYTTHACFNKVMDKQAECAVEIIQKIVQNLTCNKNILTKDSEDRMHILQDSNDTILERINTNMDEILGINQKQPPSVLTEVKMRSPAVSNYQLSNLKNATPTSSPVTKLVTAKNIIRPQTNFTIPVDNSNNPFMPRLREKPNAIKPFILTPEFDEDGNVIAYQHPYGHEVDSFEPSDDILKKVETEEPSKIEDTNYIFVDKLDELKKMMKHLNETKEIAVDVEHHSYRTFLGITCLLQISTREVDYIIDTIALRDELHILNQVFTNPNIVKILHGAESDVEWLQRDLSIYIVNLFDTHKASKRLGFPRLSLAYLLKHYCNLDADKTFQLADWRIRPLPEEFLRYAQQDTHFLLYIYDRLRNDLIDMANGATNLLSSVFSDSKLICMKRYEKPVFNSQSYKELYIKLKKSFNPNQMNALMKLYQWRDEMARKEDESYQYVLPNHMLLQISEVLPREMQGILACCNPIPPLVRQNLNEMHQLILQARQSHSLENSNKIEKPIDNSAISRKEFLDNPLYSPHDYRHHAQEEQQIQTHEDISKIKFVKAPLKLTAIKSCPKTPVKLLKSSHLTPFDRFILMIPIMQELAKKQEQVKASTSSSNNKSISKIEIKEKKETKNELKTDEFMACTSLRKQIQKEKKKNAAIANEKQEDEQPVHAFTPPAQRMSNKRKFKNNDNRQSSNKPINMGNFDYSQNNSQQFKRFKKTPDPSESNQKNGKKNGNTFKFKNQKKNKKNNNNFRATKF